MRRRKEYTRLSLFADNMTLYLKSTRRQMIKNDSFNKRIQQAPSYKIKIHTSIVFCINHLENAMDDKNAIYNTTKI